VSEDFELRLGPRPKTTTSTREPRTTSNPREKVKELSNKKNTNFCILFKGSILMVN
jgi:hypothetical protein